MNRPGEPTTRAEHDDGRRFLLRMGGSLCLLLVCYWAIAYLINPDGYFSVAVFRPLVLDARRTKAALFADYQRGGAVDGLILGSSRTMLVSPRKVAAHLGGRFFNFTVDSARAEDYLAIYRWTRHRGAAPRFLVIGLDVEALHDDDRLDERLRLNPELMRELDSETGGSKLAEAKPWLEMAQVVMSKRYALDCARSLLSPGSHAPELARFDPDGMLHYPRWEEELRQGVFDRASMIDGSRAEYTNRFRGMTSLSAKRIGRLEELLAQAARDKASTVVFITPLHPAVVSTIARATLYSTLLSATQAYLARLPGRFAVEVVDLSDAARFGGNDDEWWDGGHTDEASSDKIADVVARKLKGDAL